MGREGEGKGARKRNRKREREEKGEDEDGCFGIVLLCLHGVSYYQQASPDVIPA